MSIGVNVRMSKIMRTPIKVGALTYASCLTLKVSKNQANDLNIEITRNL